MAEVLAIFLEADTWIKVVQIGDHEIKQYIFLMTRGYLTDIAYIIRIQVILKL